MLCDIIRAQELEDAYGALSAQISFILKDEGFLFIGGYMTKPFKTHDQQIEILKHRGLTIDCDIKSKNYLMFNNYYNVVNRYGHFLRTPGKESFIESSNFKELVALNIYDRNLKATFYSKILEIENNLKSVVSYVFSKKFPDHNSYKDPDNYRDDKSEDVIKFLEIINEIEIKHSSRPNNAISHYINSHGHIPLWVFVNFMSFGNISFMYKLLKYDLQDEISKFFSMNLNKEYNRNDFFVDSGTLTNYIDALNFFRNATAHDECIITFTYRSSVRYNTKLHNMFGISYTAPRQNLFNMMVIMRVFLYETQFERLYDTTIKRSRELTRNLKSISSDDIFIRAGFSSKWCKSLKYAHVLSSE